jgi:hypothetical protein
MKEATLRAAIPLLSQIVFSILAEPTPGVGGGASGYVGAYGGANYFLWKDRDRKMQQYCLAPWPITVPTWRLSVSFDIILARANESVVFDEIDIDFGEDEFYRDMIMAKMAT